MEIVLAVVVFSAEWLSSQGTLVFAFLLGDENLSKVSFLLDLRFVSSSLMWAYSCGDVHDTRVFDSP